VTLENAGKPELKLATAEAPAKTPAPEAAKPDPTEDEEGELEGESDVKAGGRDAIKNETLNILNDLISLSRTPKPATAAATSK
jgi:hypothetical protein